MSLTFEAKVQRQERLEACAIQDGVKAYHDMVREKKEKGDICEVSPFMRLMERAMPPLISAIDEFKASNKAAGYHLNVRQEIKSIPSTDLAYLALRYTMDAIGSDKFLQMTCRSIGQAIIDHKELMKFKEKAPGYVHTINRSMDLRGTSSKRRRETILIKKKDLGIEAAERTEVSLMNIGLKLVDMVIQSTGLVEKKESIQHGNLKLYLGPSRETAEYLKKAHEICEVLNPPHGPMIVPPKPWTSTTGGGFLVQVRPSRLIKSRIKEHHSMQDIETLKPVLDAVNAMQNTAWRINKPVLEVLKQVWESEDHLGLLPSTDEPHTTVPQKPWSSDSEYRRMCEDEHGSKVISAWKTEARDIYEEWYRNASKRAAVSRKIAIGTKYQDEEELFFVYFLDWRGRVYPVQSFVNPQSDDSGSALIEFAHGKPLTEAGVKWLAYHVANSYGFDKASKNDRYQWVLDNEEAILMSARDPLGAGVMWRELGENKKPKADSPFCFLAACMAWAGYKEQGPDYVCHLPIQVDGSCNGLQHFSALLADPIGGKAVNLAPPKSLDDKPSDVYGEIAEVVKTDLEPLLRSTEVYREREAKGGKMVKHYVGALARALWGKVTRSTVKKNVMTTPYGATKRGMVGQNLKTLREAGNVEYHDDFVIGQFLTDRTYEAIGKVVVAAREAMDWFHKVAETYNKAEQPVVWRTPVGFTVVQGYKKVKLVRVNTVLGNTRIVLGLRKDTDDIDKQKQKNGIAPNFVHSMDAAHLVLTVNAAVKEGILDHSMIHDSYGTHACDMDRYSHIIREEFVKLYNGKDYLKEFELLSKAAVGDVPESPEMGSLDIKDVLGNPYFFA